MSGEHVLIVGAGHAGGTMAAMLRQYGHEGPITLLGDDPLPPYQRPPLSKAWLKGAVDAEALALKPLTFYAEKAIDLRTGVRVVCVNRSAKLVSLSDGTLLGYDRLVLATGARAIPLPVDGADLEGVCVLRTAADADELKGRLGAGRSLAVIGAGYVGLEVAAAARALGANVVVIEREARILARVACEPLADFFHAYHQRNEVGFELSATVAGFQGLEGRLSAVTLADGRTLPCDVAVVGIGAHPNDELAHNAGLQCARGVVVDLDARSVTDPDIFAIGDVAHRPMPIYDRMFRLESVPNALEQAKQAASAIVGRPRPPAECPWQWSDQYDLKLQIAGYAFEADRYVVRGDPASGRFAVFHLKGDQLQSVEAVNAPPEFMAGKALILSRRSIDPGRLVDTSITMRDVAAAPATYQGNP